MKKMKLNWSKLECGVGQGTQLQWGTATPPMFESNNRNNIPYN